jgi:hypothetical protein
MSENQTDYPLRLDVDYPEKLNRGTTFLRIIWIIPIAIILGLISGAGVTVTNTVVLNEANEIIRTTQETAGGLVIGISGAVALMLLFRRRYPRWWFDFLRELTRFEIRVASYFCLLTDQYPSTVEEQTIHLEIDYPDAEVDLNRWLPLFKWLFVIPHFVVLSFLVVGGVFALFFAWIAIIVTGRYPKGLFAYNVGILRWLMRVNAYAFLLVTDTYPPFSLH